MKSNNTGTGKKIAFLQKKYRSKPLAAGEISEKLYSEFISCHQCTDCAVCCKKLGPRITRHDIQLLAKKLGLKENTLTLQYFKTDEDGDIVFRSMPCPFSVNDNLCKVYEARPRACSEYPHISRHSFYKLLKTHEKNYRYCPAVVYVIDKLYELSQ